MRARWLAVSLLLAGILAAGPAAACPWHKSFYAMGIWGPPQWILLESDRIGAIGLSEEWTGRLPGDVTSVPVGGTPAEVGQWQPPVDWPVIAIHAALLSNGKVLHYSYPYGGPGSAAYLWDPRTELFEDVSMSQDIFCSGLSFLRDGRLLVTGGNDAACDFQGRTDSHLYDPRSGAWSEQDEMSVGRWYPTNVTLGDGSNLVLSGLDLTCELTPVMERFTPNQGMQVVPEGQRSVQLYPRLHLLSDGSVAHVAPEPATARFDLAVPGWLGVGATNFGWRFDGSTALVPGHPDEVLSCGGSGAVVTDTCERIDLAAASPAWQYTGSMNFPRSHGDLLILPDRTVLMVGGGREGLYGSPVMNAEIYDPETEAWTLVPAHVHGRMYHSTTVLLPDGRVLAAGQDFGESAFTAEIYEPPYLFRGPRPRITSSPKRVGYGDTFPVGSPDADSIAAVALLAPTTTTHSVNNSQRYVDLAFALGQANELVVTAPAGANLAPPGAYMLFLIDGDGVPSEARFVSLTP